MRFLEDTLRAWNSWREFVRKGYSHAHLFVRWRDRATASIVCARCGSINPSEYRFCAVCGTALTGPAPASSAATAPLPLQPYSHPVGAVGGANAAGKTTWLVLVAVIATLVALAGIGAFMVVQFGRTPPNSAAYGAAIQVGSAQCSSTFQGQYPLRAYWLILGVILSNTGGFALTPGGLDWVVTNADASHPTYLSGNYSTQTVPAGGTASFTLAFDIDASASPSFLTLALPNGARPTASFFGCGPRTIGIAPARSADGTNWTLTFTFVSSGLSTNGTRLTIVTGGGSTVLAAKPFSALVYGVDRAAYFQAVFGPSVGVGDRLLISTTTYPTGYTYQISDGTSILAAGTLQ